MPHCGVWRASQGVHGPLCMIACRMAENAVEDSWVLNSQEHGETTAKPSTLLSISITRVFIGNRLYLRRRSNGPITLLASSNLFLYCSTIPVDGPSLDALSVPVVDRRDRHEFDIQSLFFGRKLGTCIQPCRIHQARGPSASQALEAHTVAIPHHQGGLLPPPALQPRPPRRRRTSIKL